MPEPPQSIIISIFAASRIEAAKRRARPPRRVVRRRRALLAVAVVVAIVAVVWFASAPAHAASVTKPSALWQADRPPTFLNYLYPGNAAGFYCGPRVPLEDVAAYRWNGARADRLVVTGTEVRWVLRHHGYVAWAPQASPMTVNGEPSASDGVFTNRTDRRVLVAAWCLR